MPTYLFLTKNWECHLMICDKLFFASDNDITLWLCSLFSAGTILSSTGTKSPSANTTLSSSFSP